MTYMPNKTSRLPVLGLLEKNDPTNPQTLAHSAISSITFVDNSNSTDPEETDNLKLKNKNALVFAQFSREDEKDSSTVSILVGDSNDETRIARVVGETTNDKEYKYQSSSIAIDKISASNGLNIRKYYTNNDSDTVDYGDGTYIFFIRSSH